MGPTHDAAGRGSPVQTEPRYERAQPAGVAFAGVLAGLVGAGGMVVTICLISEISAAPTVFPGIRSSAWTPITGVTGMVFGPGAVHGWFHIGPIAFGLFALALYGTVLGLLGTSLVAFALGPTPGRFGSTLFGLVYGVFAEILVLNAIVNTVQGVPTVYGSAPSWGWWVAHAVYGATMGLVASAVLWTRVGAKPGVPQ